MTTDYLFAMHNVKIFGREDNYHAGREYASLHPELYWFFDGVHDSYLDQADKDWKTGKFELNSLGHDLCVQSDIVSHYFHNRDPFIELRDEGYISALARYDASYLFYKGVFDGIYPFMKDVSSDESDKSFYVQKELFLETLLKMWVLSYDKMLDEFEINPPLLDKIIKS